MLQAPSACLHVLLFLKTFVSVPLAQVSCSRLIYMLWHCSFLSSCIPGKHSGQMQWTSGPHKLRRTKRHSIHNSCPPISKVRPYHTSRIILLFKTAPCPDSKSLCPQPGPTLPDHQQAVKAAQVGLIESYSHLLGIVELIQHNKL